MTFLHGSLCICFIQSQSIFYLYPHLGHLVIQLYPHRVGGNVGGTVGGTIGGKFGGRVVSSPGWW